MGEIWVFIEDSFVWVAMWLQSFWEGAWRGSSWFWMMAWVVILPVTSRFLDLRIW